MKRVSCIITSVLFFNAFAWAGDAPPPTTKPSTIIEVSQPLSPTGGMATVAEVGTQQEQAFRKRVTEVPINHWAGLEVPPMMGEKVDPKRAAEEKARQLEELEKAKAYSLAEQAGKYVGWFGIVRKSSWNDAAQRTDVLLQHCYFDGLSDPDIQVVSIYGAGDFRAIVADKAKTIPHLGLVRVYGTVSAGTDGVPEVMAEYIRVWDWGTFTFMDYGIDRTNATWRTMRNIDAEQIYMHRPSKQYYEAVLGKRNSTEQAAQPVK